MILPLLLAGHVAFMQAQYPVAPRVDVTLEMSAGTPEWCQGPVPPFFAGQIEGTPDDVTLRLPLRVRYRNHGSETVLLPAGFHALTEMTVNGHDESTILRDRRRPMDVEAALAASDPEAGDFLILDSDVRYLTRCLSPTDHGCSADGAVIRVVDGSSGLDLRGQTLRVVMTRDHRPLPPAAVAALNERWADYGTFWAGVVESEAVTINVPVNPLTRDCSLPR